MLGSPLHPVRRGELTVKGLGMSVEIYNSKNESVIGEPGDLVCTEPFPSMPITFWGKDGDARYKKTYFEERKEVWTHGDLAELKPHGSGVIYGRTDNTLNPGGVRIGTAEIYNICELFTEIEDCLVFGNQINNDEEIILCIKLSHNNKLDNKLSKIIRSKIRENASPRHVPQKIYDVHTHIYQWASNLDKNKNKGPYKYQYENHQNVSYELLDQVDKKLMPGRSVERLSFPFPYNYPCDFNNSNNYVSTQTNKYKESDNLILINPKMDKIEILNYLESSKAVGFKPYRTFSKTGDITN